MAKLILTSTCLALLVWAVQGISTDHVGKLAQSHSAILEKFQPSVIEFSKTLVAALGGSVDLEKRVSDVITKDLALYMDKLAIMTNGSDTSMIEMCCKCGRCKRSCKACGKTCCCDGDQGCSCDSCVSGGTVKLSDVGSLSSTIKLWSETSVRELRRDVSRVLAHSNKANDACCACDYCTETKTACNIPDCCSSGTGCVCKSCSTSNLLLQADSISNPIHLNPKVKSAVDQLGLLFDSLVLRLTS